MPRAVEVFTPNAQPTYTYVERKTINFEERLREAITIPNMIVSLSGPSKSGKTVLVNRVIESDNLIPLSGASIRTADDLWNRVLSWMEIPTKRVETKGSSFTGSLAGYVGGGKSSETSETFQQAGLDQVVREIGSSDFVIFVDDFHYIPKDVQEEIGRQIKEAAERGVRICTASVPHRADDVVRSNTELRGRVTAIDTNYWNEDELAQIGYRGFEELNLDVSPRIMETLTAEAFGSPQLMQAICLNFCFEVNVTEALLEKRRIDPDFVMLQKVLERTSTMTDFSSMLEALHSGPRQRGQERRVFSFSDDSNGDVYRCILLAMRADPPRLAFPYDDLLGRIRKVTKGDSPVGSSVTQALTQMEAIGKTMQNEPLIEWDEDVLDVVEPYFLFFLRCSNYLQKLKNA